jgi:sodium bicarbonate transporter 10
MSSGKIVQYEVHDELSYGLQKGCGYHLDLFVLAVLIIICSAMGLPWFVAATVLSINHVNSLKLESECAAPGEKPHFLGVRYVTCVKMIIII